MFKFLSSLGSAVGIDLGTANTLVYVQDKGIVVQEPSVVAIMRSTGKVLAVGDEAKSMLGRTPGDIIAVRPLRHGVIADFNITQKLLVHFIRKAIFSRSLIKPKVVIGVPSVITEVEKRAVISAATEAGAREVYLIEEPMAAAIGSGLPVSEPTGSMVVDIGGGTTDIAVISLGGIVCSQAIRIGGDEMDESIIQYVRRTYNLIIGERMAEKIKVVVGSAMDIKGIEEMHIKGRDVLTGLPKALLLSAEEIRTALAEPVAAIVEAVQITLEQTPPELAADIMERGIMLTGGGSLLRGLDQLLSRETGIPVCIADEPLACVANGTGKALDSLQLIKPIEQSGFFHIALCSTFKRERALE